MRAIVNLSRRGVLRGIAAGSATFVLGGEFLASGRALAVPNLPTPFAPNLFVSIGIDGTVTLTAHRSDMGQGIRTGLAQLLADELEADWNRIVVTQAEGDEKYGDQYTDGSRSVVKNFQRMREFGAAARMMLEQAAAKSWGVDVSECRARNHEVVHVRREKQGEGFVEVATGRKAGFGELAPIAAELPVPRPEELKLKPRKDWRYIGKPMRQVDLDDITHGRAVYGIDVRLPGMKYASIQRCPVLLGRLVSYDASEALKVPGVERVVEIPPPKEPVEFQALGGLAVVASNTWAAMEGRKRLKIQWDPGPHAVYESSAYRKALETTATKPGKVRRVEGDVDAAFADRSLKVVEAAYWSPHFVHAPMEVPAAVADVRDDRAEVWACCQDAQALRKTAAAAIGMDAANVTAHVTLLGGAFGRKSKPDFGAEAAFVSKAVGAPVKVTWSREDDIRNGYYHAAAAQTVRAALGADGKPVAWHHRTVFPPIMSIFDQTQRLPWGWELDFGLTDLPYAIPNIRLEAGEADVHVRIGWKRSVQNIFHAFAIGSFVDELAVAAGNRDRVEYLLELIGPPRHIDLTQGGVADYFNYDGSVEIYPVDTGRLAHVVKLAAEKARWGQPLGPRRGMGIAAHRSFLTYVATVVETEVAPDGTVHIPRVVMAVDAGTVVNPDRVKAQMEGACIYALSAAFFGEITAKDGAIQQSNFHDYPVARMANAPRRIEVHLVESEAPPGGVGEPGVPPFAPALCNAIFAATGKRIRSLPIVHEDLKAI
ncbi:molybdopterin cofactor-binding domain-containing protein [Benzoatithermus flavus]|uniref:Molybdopterin cofactor-binding domain-containing protein n=1 Tax=Benzoatithermus flavus TaxID=3108223 RepID=A0ABU8XPI0_9PROT